MDSVPHLSMPMRVIGDSYETVQQDTDAEASQCVRNILSFGKGDRIEDLDFGIDDPTFQTQPIDIDDIARAISEYEPRVDAEIETEDLPDGQTSVRVYVSLPDSGDDSSSEEG
jgi:phage baseplate assembly protein W